MASRTELKGWGCWRNIRGTDITLEEAKSLVSVAKARLKQYDLSMFDWDLTDRDQGIFDTKMMVFRWFKDGVTPMARKRVQDLTNLPLPFKGAKCEGYPPTRSGEETLEQGPSHFHRSDEGICQTPSHQMGGVGTACVGSDTARQLRDTNTDCVIHGGHHLGAKSRKSPDLCAPDAEAIQIFSSDA